MAAKKKYYAYAVPSEGREGIAERWAECERNVSGKPGARYRGFDDRVSAVRWLAEGARYTARERKKVPPGIYFDAGTGRGKGVEVSVTDERGTNLLHKAVQKGVLNRFGKHLVPHEATNNYGELLAAKHALTIALKTGAKRVLGDSALVVNYWSRGIVRKDRVDARTAKLAASVARLRKKFEAQGGIVARVSGDDNPADLGFHR
jgi:ribonuclease H-related protein